MTESQFISSIDCRFPYHDETEAQRLVALGCSISPNAAFTVVHELARVPASVEVSTEALLRYLHMVRAHLHHPLGASVLGVAERVIRDDRLSLPEVLDAMREVAVFPDQYQALNVIYFSGADAWEQVDEAYKEITAKWRGAAEPGDAVDVGPRA